MAADTTTAILFKRFVEEGLPLPDDFQQVQVPAPAGPPEAGKIVVELIYLSVDPYMRGRMKDMPGYFVPPFQPGKPLGSLAIAAVRKTSQPEAFPEGSLVLGLLDWVQVQAVDPASLTRLPESILSELGASPFLGALGMVGLTSWGSLERIGKPKAGETAFVSGAAGAVGLIVGQLLKNVYGCRVVGSAGSDEKVALLTSQFGFDAAFNYKKLPQPTLTETLKALCPNGIDVYFDNVGGEHLEAALNVCNVHARIVACGSISGYNAKQPYGVTNLFNIVTKRIKMEGFISAEFADMRQQFTSAMAQYLKEGKVRNVEHLVEGGLQAAGPAFISMMEGGNIGKTIIQCGPDPYRK